MRIGIDSGGTFTDFAWDGGVLKLPSTPHDPAAAILQGIELILASYPSLDPASIELVHGTTVATNALLTRTGAKVALLTSAGFEDVIEIGRQDRPDLYALHPALPPPLVPPAMPPLGPSETMSRSLINVSAIEPTTSLISSPVMKRAMSMMCAFRSP